MLTIPGAGACADNRLPLARTAMFSAACIVALCLTMLLLLLRTLRVAQNPFEVGDEIHFFHSNKVVEGFVIDIGW